MDDDWLKPRDVAEHYPLSVQLLAQLRFRGSGPVFYKPTPRTILYRRVDVEAWISASAQTSTTGLGVA